MNGRRPTVMLDGRKSIVQSRWPGRPAVLSRRKSRDRHAGLETAERGRRKSTECLRPYPEPERAKDKKERHSAEGLSNSGNRLQPLGTRKEDVARRTPSVKLPVTEGGTMVEKSTGLREAASGRCRTVRTSEV